MNDRYLYRAKRKSDKRWIYGNLIHTDDGVYIIQNYVPQHLIGKYEVDTSTICQCTGLKDKNGKLIWENDVVTGCFDGKRITGYIMYGSNATFFIERKGLYGIHLDNSEDWLEVIGNIFDEGSENIGKGAKEN